MHCSSAPVHCLDNQPQESRTRRTTSTRRPAPLSPKSDVAKPSVRPSRQPRSPLTGTSILSPRATRSGPTCHSDANNFSRKKPITQSQKLKSILGRRDYYKDTSQSGLSPHQQPIHTLRCPRRGLSLIRFPRSSPLSSSPLTQIEPSEAVPVIRSMRGAW